MEKVFKNVLSEICNKQSFSFEVSEAGILVLNYGDNGSAKISLNKVTIFTKDSYGNNTKNIDKEIEREGVKEFIDALQAHKNCTAGQVDPTFYNSLSAKVMIVKSYKKEKGFIYYDREKNLVLSGDVDLTNENTVKAEVFAVDQWPGVKVARVKNSGLCLLFNGHLFGAEGFASGESKDRIENLINGLSAFIAGDELEEYLQQCIDSKILKALQGGQAIELPAAKAEVKMEAVKPEISKMQVNEAGEIEKKAEEVRGEGYLITSEIVYFSPKNFIAMPAFRGAKKGQVVLLDRFPGVKLVKHAVYDGSYVSFLYKNLLMEFNEPLEGDQIKAAIAKIAKDGLENIIRQAEAGMAQLMAA